MTDLKRIERALISVSDKTGVVEFARSLAKFGIEIISTGGTAKTLRENGIQVTDVSDVTGFPEMMDGRVKTLHPKIHGALLALRDNDEHVSSMAEYGIKKIDMVVVNLYPFEQTVAKEAVTLKDAIDNIDIGGPAIIRSGSKNWRDVTVVTDPKLYDGVIDELNREDGAISILTRERLAALAYTRTASYDLAISSYLAKQLTDEDLEFLEPLNPLGGLIFIEPADTDAEIPDEEAFTEDIRIELAKVSDLRYGENPHQRAALYSSNGFNGIALAEQLNGKEMSYNNYVDADAAWALVNDFDETAVAIIKHTNPSGVGTGGTLLEAYKRALSTDPVSAFGGIVALNRPVDQGVAKLIIEVFSEVIVAAEYDEAALEIFRTKKNLRVLKASCAKKRLAPEYKQISGGFLVQEADMRRLFPSDLNIVTEREPNEVELDAMLLAWKVCKHVKSNAIVLANETQTLGVGTGQMNRVDSIRIAGIRSARFDHDLKGAALASDAFFPFRDNVDEAASLGISAIIQPGGSIKDEDSIAAANEHGIAMVFTGVRHFKH